MVRFLHLADLHLGAEPSFLKEQAKIRSDDFDSAFERAVEFALEPDNDIHFVIIAGDLFGKQHPSLKTLRFAIEQLQNLRQSNIPIILAPGKCDALGYQNSVYADPRSDIRKKITFIDSPNVERVATIDCEDEVVHIYGMSWHSELSQPPFDNFRANRKDGGFHITVIHGTLESAQFAEQHKPNIVLQPDHLAASEMDYIALGQIHFPQIHMAGSIPVVYPGTLEGVRFVPEEFGKRNLVVVNLEEGKQAEINFIPWNHRELQEEHIDLDNESIETESKLIELIRERYSDRNKILRLEIQGSAAFLIEERNLSKALAEDFYWIELIDKTNLFGSQLVEMWAKEQNIGGIYCQKLTKLFDEEDNPREKQKIELALQTAIRAFNKTLRSR